MKTQKHELRQFNRSDSRISGQNITEAISSLDDILFNESYIVIGDCITKSNVNAMYDLSIYGSVKADLLNVNGDLFVSGDIEVNELNCNSELLCNGRVNAEKIFVSGKAIVDSVNCKEFESYNDVIARSTLDIDSKFSSSGQVIAYEGILGAGEFKSEFSIVKDYFEFDGNIIGNVFSLSDLDNMKKEDNKPKNSDEDISVVNSPIELEKQFADAVRKSWSELAELDEEELLKRINEMVYFDPQIYSIGTMVNKIVELGYLNHIENLRDYLLIIYGKSLLPEELRRYDTITCVFDILLPEAEEEIENMVYHAESIEEFSISLRILNTLLPVSFALSYDEIADRIFSSIGLKYTTVKNAIEQ